VSKSFLSPTVLLPMTGIGFLIIFPLVFSGGFILHIATLILLWGMICSSLNIIFGYAGQLSVAHGGLFGVGAYVYGVLATKFGMNFWFAISIAGMTAGLIGFLIGLPSLKLKGPYFVIVTLGFNVIIETIIENFESVTDGVNGLVGIPSPGSIPLGFCTIAFDSKIAQYYLILFFLILFWTVMYMVKNSLLGRTLFAIKGDEDLCKSVGINTMRVKVQAFTLSSVLAGLAGVFYASYVGIIVPRDASFHFSFEALVFLTVGGVGTTIGTVIGPALMLIISELLQAVVEAQLLFNGIALMVLIIFMPKGLGGAIGSVWNYVTSNRYGFALKKLRI
jgi:branched-chain amino acid transport system permease protein